MFGWLKSKTKAEEQRLPEVIDGPDGRPRPPHFSGLMNDLGVTREQRILALEWAIRWRKVEALTPEDLIDDLDQLLSGRPLKNKHPHRVTVGMARRALNLSARRNSMHRAKRGLPWVEIRLGPQETPCAAALELSGTVLAVVECPELPLVGCDQNECKCWTRSLTDTQLKARNER